jgi:hypothetical protein
MLVAGDKPVTHRRVLLTCAHETVLGNTSAHCVHGCQPLNQPDEPRGDKELEGNASGSAGSGASLRLVLLPLCEVFEEQRFVIDLRRTEPNVAEGNGRLVWLKGSV